MTIHPTADIECNAMTDSSPLRLVSTGHFRDLPTHYTHRPAPTNYLIIWVLGGRGFARSRGQDVIATPGDLLVFHPSHEQEYGSDAHVPWDIVWAHFEGTSAPSLIEQIAADGTLRVPFGIDGRLRDRFMELVAHSPASTPQLKHLVNCLLWGILGLIIYRRQTASTGRDDDDSRLMHTIHTLVQERLAEPIQMDDLAELVNTSPRQLNRLFHRLFGTTPMHYVLQQRLARAAALLEQTTLSVGQVAQKVGIPDPFYFSRLFTRHMQRSPSDWRRKRG